MKKIILISFVLTTITCFSFGFDKFRFDVKQVNRQYNYVRYNITNYDKDFKKVKYQIIGYDQHNNEIIVDYIIFYNFKYNDTKTYKSYISKEVESNDFTLKLIEYEN